MLIALGDGDTSNDENEGNEEGKSEFLTYEDDTTEDTKRWYKVDVEG